MVTEHIDHIRTVQPTGPYPGCHPRPEEHDVLALLLEVFGHTPIDVDRSLSESEVVAMLRDEDGDGGLLASMEERHIVAFIEIFVNNVALRPASVVGTFDGTCCTSRRCMTRQRTDPPDKPGGRW
jgi:hypothetical protein